MRIYKLISIIITISILIQDIAWASPGISTLHPKSAISDQGFRKGFMGAYTSRVLTDEDRGRVRSFMADVTDPRVREVVGDIFGLDLSNIPESPAMENIDIKNIITDIVKMLLENPELKEEIEAIYLFGSVATGTANGSSDIDLFVRFKGLPRLERRFTPRDEAFYERIQRLDEQVQRIRRECQDRYDINIDIYYNAISHPEIAMESEIDWDIAIRFEEGQLDRILIWQDKQVTRKPASEIIVETGAIRIDEAKEREILKLIRNIQEAEYRVRLVDGKVQEVVLISANIPEEYESQLKGLMQERLEDAFNKLLERENFLPGLDKAPQEIIVRFHTQTTEEGQMRLGRIPEFLPHNTQGLVELHPLALLSSLLLQYGLRHELDHAWYVYPIGIEVDLPLEEGRVIMNDRSFFETLTKEEQEELLSHLSPENLNGVDMGGKVYKELYKIYSRPREKPDEKFSFQPKEPAVVFNRKGHRFAYRYIDEDNPIEMILGNQMIRIVKSNGELIFLAYHLHDMSQPVVEFKVDTDRTIKIGRRKMAVGIVRDEEGREIGHEAVVNDIDLPDSNGIVSRRHIKLTIENIKGKRTRIIFEDLTSKSGSTLYAYGQAIISVQPKILMGVVEKEEDALTLKKKEMNKIVKQLNFRIGLSEEGWQDRVREEFIKERDRLMQGLTGDERRNFEEEYSDRFLNIWVENLEAFKEYILFLREMKINLVIRRKGEITDTFRQLVQRQVKMLRRIPIGLLAKAREFFPYVISEEQVEMQKDGRLLGFKRRGTHGTVMLRNEGFRGSTVFSRGSLGGSRGMSVILSAQELSGEEEGRRSEMAVSPETTCAHELYHHLHLEEDSLPVRDFIEMLKIAERRYWWHSSMLKTGKTGHASDVVRIIEEALAQDEEKGKEGMLVVCQEYFMLHSTFYTPAEVVSFCLSHDIGAEKELGSQRFHKIRQIGYRNMLRSENPVANRPTPLYEIYTFRENRHWIDYGDEKGNILIYGNSVIRNDTHKLGEDDRRVIEEAVKYKFVETICRDPALGSALKCYINLLAGVIKEQETQVFFMDDMEKVLGSVENREQIFKIHRYINDAIYTAGYQISFRDRYEILNRLFKDFNPAGTPTMSRDKGVLISSYWLADNITNMLGLKMSKDSKEDFIVPIIEEAVLLLGFLFGNWGYAIGRLIFVILHGFQDYRPPKGRKRAFFEKIFIPFVISVITFIPFAFLTTVSISHLFILGLSMHILANLYVTLTGSRLQKGVYGKLERNIMYITEGSRLIQKEAVGRRFDQVVVIKYPNCIVKNVWLDSEGGLCHGGKVIWHVNKKYANRRDITVEYKDGEIIKVWAGDPYPQDDMTRPNSDAPLIWPLESKNVVYVFEDNRLIEREAVGNRYSSSAVTKYPRCIVKNVWLNSSGGLYHGGKMIWNVNMEYANCRDITIEYRDGKIIRAWLGDPYPENDITKPNPDVPLIWPEESRNVVYVLEDNRLIQKETVGDVYWSSVVTKYPNCIVKNVWLSNAGELAHGGKVIWRSKKEYANRRDITVEYKDGRIICVWAGDPYPENDITRPNPDVSFIWQYELRNVVYIHEGSSLIQKDAVGERYDPSVVTKYPNCIVKNVWLSNAGGLAHGGKVIWSRNTEYANRTDITVEYKDGEIIRAWAGDTYPENDVTRPNPDVPLIWQYELRNVVYILEGNRLIQKLAFVEKYSPSNVTKYPNCIVKNVWLNSVGGLKHGGKVIWYVNKEYANRRDITVEYKDGEIIRAWAGDTYPENDITRPNPDVSFIWQYELRNVVYIHEGSSLIQKDAVGERYDPSVVTKYPNCIVKNVWLSNAGGLAHGGKVIWSRNTEYANRTDITVEYKDGRIIRAWAGDPYPENDIAKPNPDIPVIWQADKKGLGEAAVLIQDTLKELFPEDVIFLAARYGLDIKIIIWGIVGSQLAGKYDRGQIESLIDQEIIGIIDKAVTEKDRVGVLSQVKAGEGEAEEPSVFDAGPLSQEAISRIAGRIHRKIEEGIVDKGLKDMANRQAVSFIRKLEENHFFKKFYNPSPDKFIGENARKEIEDILKTEREGLIIDALKELLVMVEEALRLQDELYKRGLNRETVLNLYQLIGVLQMLKEEKVVLADEMGLGKTLETIATFLMTDLDEMLVIAPKQAIRRWMEDLARHTDLDIDLVLLTNQEPIEELSGNPRIRVERMLRPKARNEYLLNPRQGKGRKRIILVNYELMPYINLYRTENKLGPVKADFLALDEVHLIKNPNTLTSQAIFGLKKGRGAIKSGYKVCISGTPLENEPRDVLTYLRYLAAEGRGDAEKMFREIALEKLTHVFPRYDIAKLSLLHGYLVRHMIRRLKADVVKGLPVKRTKIARLDVFSRSYTIDGEGPVVLDGNYSRQLGLYETALQNPKQFERMVVQKASDLSEDIEEEIEEMSDKARQILRLEQAGIGPSIFGEEGDSIKFDAAKRLIEERIRQGKSVVVFTNFRTAARNFREFIEKEYKDTIAYVDGTVVDTKMDMARTREIKRFQNKEARIMIATIGTMGLGIELTQADSLIFLNYPWKPSTLNQAIDRAHRLDSVRNYEGKELEIIHLELDLPISIDRLKAEVLRRKEILAGMIIEGNLTPEILAAFRESDLRIMQEIEEGAKDKISLDEYELTLMQRFRLLIGEILGTTDPTRLKQLWDEVSLFYLEVLEHKGSFFANMASLDYLSGAGFPELKDRVLDTLDLGSGPSTLYRAYERKKGKFEKKDFRLKITDYDLSPGMLSLGVARQEAQVQGSFEALDRAFNDDSFDIVNLSYAYRYASSPAKLIRNIHRILRDRGVFVMILPKTTKVPDRFFEALTQAGFDIKVGKGSKLLARLDMETYRKLLLEYGKEFADDIMKESEGEFTYLVANKKRPISGELKDEDLRLYRDIPCMDRGKIERLRDSPGKYRILPPEGTVEGKVVATETAKTEKPDKRERISRGIDILKIHVNNYVRLLGKKETKKDVKRRRDIEYKVDLLRKEIGIKKAGLNMQQKELLIHKLEVIAEMLDINPKLKQKFIDLIRILSEDTDLGGGGIGKHVSRFLTAIALALTLFGSRITLADNPPPSRPPVTLRELVRTRQLGPEEKLRVAWDILADTDPDIYSRYSRVPVELDPRMIDGAASTNAGEMNVPPRIKVSVPWMEGRLDRREPKTALYVAMVLRHEIQHIIDTEGATNIFKWWLAMHKLMFGGEERAFDKEQGLLDRYDKKYDLGIDRSLYQRYDILIDTRYHLGYFWTKIFLLGIDLLMLGTILWGIWRVFLRKRFGEKVEELKERLIDWLEKDDSDFTGDIWTWLQRFYARIVGSTPAEKVRWSSIIFTIGLIIIFLGSPGILFKILTTMVLLSLGDFFAQLVEGKSIKALDRWRLTYMAILGCLYAVIWHFYYNGLEMLFPGSAFLTAVIPKILIDQTFFTAPFNLLNFFMIALFTGRLSEYKSTIKKHFRTAIITNWAFWIPAHLVNFLYIPLEYRVLYVGLISLIWNPILSMIGHGEWKGWLKRILSRLGKGSLRPGGFIFLIIALILACVHPIQRAPAAGKKEYVTEVVPGYIQTITEGVKNYKKMSSGELIEFLKLLFAKRGVLIKSEIMVDLVIAECLLVLSEKTGDLTPEQIDTASEILIRGHYFVLRQRLLRALEYHRNVHDFLTGLSPEQAGRQIRILREELIALLTRRYPGRMRHTVVLLWDLYNLFFISPEEDIKQNMDVLISILDDTGVGPGSLELAAESLDIIRMRTGGLGDYSYLAAIAVTNALHSIVLDETRSEKDRYYGYVTIIILNNLINGIMPSLDEAQRREIAERLRYALSRINIENDLARLAKASIMVALSRYAPDAPECSRERIVEMFLLFVDRWDYKWLEARIETSFNRRRIDLFNLLEAVIYYHYQSIDRDETQRIMSPHVIDKMLVGDILRIFFHPEFQRIVCRASCGPGLIWSWLIGVRENLIRLGLNLKNSRHISWVLNLMKAELEDDLEREFLGPGINTLIIIANEEKSFNPDIDKALAISHGVKPENIHIIKGAKDPEINNRAKEQVNGLLETSPGPLSIWFNGHGRADRFILGDNDHILVEDLSRALFNRVVNGNGLKDVIIFTEACFGYNFTTVLYNRLHMKLTAENSLRSIDGKPLLPLDMPLVITLGHRGKVTLIGVSNFVLRQLRPFTPVTVGGILDLTNIPHVFKYQDGVLFIPVEPDRYRKEMRSKRIRLYGGAEVPVIIGPLSGSRSKESFDAGTKEIAEEIGLPRMRIVREGVGNPGRYGADGVYNRAEKGGLESADRFRDLVSDAFRDVMQRNAGKFLKGGHTYQELDGYDCWVVDIGLKEADAYFGSSRKRVYISRQILEMMVSNYSGQELMKTVEYIIEHEFLESLRDTDGRDLYFHNDVVRVLEGYYGRELYPDLMGKIRRWVDYNLFIRYWNENFVRPKKRNFFHAMVNGLAYVGEFYKKDIKIRMYPEEDGVVGVLIIDSQPKLSIRYTSQEGIRLYTLPEETLVERSGREYNWDWLEERFSLKRIRKILSLDKAVRKVVSLRRIYEGYIEKLGITPEDERRLRSNLATASYCCVIKNKTPYDVIDIYLKALGTSKEGLDLDTKKQLIIATYEVAMTGNHESLKRVIRQYSAVLGKDIPERLRLKWIIATYEVAMKGRHESLKKVIRLYRAVLGKEIPEELKEQWLTATYKVAMKGNHESLKSVIRQYRTVLGKDIPDRLRAKWLISTYEVAMNGQHESLRRVIRLYKSVLGRDIPDGLKSHWLTATYVSAMYGRHESLKKVIRLYRPVLGKSIPEELKAKWLIATSHVAARGKQESLKKVIRLYSKALGGIIPDELKGIWLTATYRIARNDNDISLKEVIKIYRSVLGEVIPDRLKRKWLIATYAVAAKGEQGSLKEVIRLYRKVLGTIPDGLKGQWLTATYDVAKNGNHRSLEKVIRLYESVLGTNIPDELKGKWLTAASRVAMDGNHNLLEEVIRQYRLVLGETIPSGLSEKWLIATYIVVINGKPELLKEILLALKGHGIFNTDDLVLKGAILIITSLIVQLPDPIAEVRRFIGSFIGITDIAKRKKAITDYRRGLYKRVVLRIADSDVVISSERTKKGHAEYHRQGMFKEVIRQIAMELGLTADNNGRYDLRKAGSQINTSHGGLRIEPDGILVIIDSRFKKDHAGRRQMAVYARNEQKARHELAELRAWIGYAKKELGMTDKGIRSGSLNRWMQDKSPPGRIKKVRELYREFHRKGIEAERALNIPLAEANARIEEGILKIDGGEDIERLQGVISNLKQSVSSRKDIRSILSFISPFKIRFVINAFSTVRIYKEGDGYILELDISNFADWGRFGVPKKLLMAELRRVTANMILDSIETDIPRDFLLDIILILLDSQDINRRYRSGNRKVIARRSRIEYLQRLRHDKGRQYVTLLKRLSHTSDLEEKVRLIYLYLEGKEEDGELLRLQNFFTQNRGTLIRIRLAYNRLERKVRIEAAPEELALVIAKQSEIHKKDFGWEIYPIAMSYIGIILVILIFFFVSHDSLEPIKPVPEEKPTPPVISLPIKKPVKEAPKPQPESFEHTVIPSKPDDCLAHIARKYYGVTSRRIEGCIAEYNNRNNPRYKIKDIDIVMDGKEIILPYRILHKVRGKNVKLSQVARMYNVSEGYLRTMNPHISLDGRLQRGDEIEIAVRIEPTYIVHAEGFRLKNGRAGLWVNGEDISIGDGIDRRKENIRTAKKNEPDYIIAGKKIYISNELIARLRDTDISWLDGLLAEGFKDSLPIKDEIFIDLLNDSLHLFEDCKENGYIGINEQLFRIQDPGLRVKLLKVGIAHELKHEAGSTKTESELLTEDVIESVKVGIGDKDMQDLAKGGILEEDCGFFKLREVLDTLWEINISNNDLRDKADLIVSLYKDYPDKKKVLEMIREYVLIPAQGIQNEWYRDLVLSDIYKAIAVLYQNEKDRSVALDVIEREALGIRDKRFRASTLASIKEPPMEVRGSQDESYALEAYSHITKRMLYIRDVPDIALADFVFGIDSILSVLALLDSFDHFEFEVLPLDISTAYSLSNNPFLRLRSSYLKRRVVEDRYSLRERVRALLLNHSNEIVSYTTDVVKRYGDSIGKYMGWGNRYIMGGLLFLETKIGKKGYRVSELIRELGISGLRKQDIVRILKEMGYGIDRGYIVTPINLVTSVYRGSAEIDHAGSRYVTHSITTALCHYARMGGEATRDREEKVVVIGNKALHEVDYALMCYEGVNTRTADENVALAFSYAGALPQYSRKRTVVIESKSTLAGLEEIREKQERERFYEANILRLLMRIANGEINRESIDNAIAGLKEQIEGLRDIVNEYYFLALYGYLDNEFYNQLSNQYKAGQKNIGLLKGLTRIAQVRQLEELTKRKDPPARYDEFLGDIRKRNVLWGHKGLNLLGYLEFKEKMRKGTYEERDVEGHFPTWQLAGLLDNLGDSAESFRLREAFIKLIKEDGEITQEELEILVKHIENVMVAIDHLIGITSDEEKKEAIIRIALYLSIEEIRRVKELEKRPKGDMRRYFYQRIEVAGRLGISPQEIESISPSSTDVAVVINKYFRDKKERQEVAGKVVDVVTRYLLNQLEVDKKTKDSIERIIRSKNIEILTPLPIVVEVSGKIILQDLSVYLSDNPDWDRENLDNMAVGVIRDLTKGNQQVMAYTDKTQKERFIRLLEEKGVTGLQDRLAFVDISQCNSYGDIKRKVTERLGLSIDELNPRLISLVKVLDKRFESEDSRDRIIIAGHGGLVDIHLMWRVALILLQSEGDIRSSLMDFLKEYYKGTEYEGEVSDLVEEMFRHSIYIVLPPIVPFIKNYYDALDDAQAVDRSA